MADPSLYVYGAVWADGAQLPDTMSLDGHPLTLAVEGSLAALVSEIDVSELRRRVEKAEDGDLSALAPWLFAHERILSQSQERGPVAPFRFGVVVEGRGAAQQLLRDRRSDLRAQLHRLRRSREWGVKGTVDADALEAFVLAVTPELAGLARQAEGSSGQAFFARKQLERGIARRMRETAAELAADAHEHISASACAAVANPPQDTRMVLNGAYLVERRNETDFAQAVRHISSGLIEKGLSLELTGPWPAFNFVEAVAPPHAK